MAAVVKSGSYIVILDGSRLIRVSDTTPSSYTVAELIDYHHPGTIPVFRHYGGKLYLVATFIDQLRLYEVVLSPFGATLKSTVSNFCITAGFNDQYVLCYGDTWLKANLATEAFETATVAAPPVSGDVYPASGGEVYLYGDTEIYRGEMDSSGDITGWTKYASVVVSPDYYSGRDIHSFAEPVPLRNVPTLFRRRPMSGRADINAALDIEEYYPDVARMVRRR